jgi:NitT/TauT family transport system substrate-binding protein
MVLSMSLSRRAMLAGTAATMLAGRATSARAEGALIAGSAPSTSILPIQLARNLGYFSKRSLDVSLELIPVAPTIIGAVRGGSIQFGALTVPALLLANDGGLDLVAVAGGVREMRSRPHTSIIARTGANLHSATDFKGKRVGVPGISSVLDIMFRDWLFRHGVDVKSVNIVEAPFATMPDQIKSGALDAVCTSEPFRSLMISNGSGYKVSDYLVELRPDSLVVLWCSTREWATAHASEIGRFRAALKDAIAYAHLNPAAALAVQANVLKAASPALADFDTGITADDIEYYVRVLKDLEMLHGSVDAGAIIAR